MQVIVHGGAGGGHEEPEERQATLEEAAATGAERGTVLDAVEAAITILEEAPRFGAGAGGAVQADGVIRTDAGVMTSGREAGAVASMPGVKHAISVARVVLEETPHVLVSGEGAVALAEDFGIETGVDLWDERTRERWAEDHPPEGAGPREQLEWLRGRFDGGDGANATDRPAEGDTVGAVARDGERFAAATSTNGRHLALAGRVGDVPSIGAGFYAAPAGAASTTGAGEDIATATLTRRCVRHLEGGHGAGAAADRAMAEFGELTGSSAGLIVLDRSGNVGTARNTEAMQTAVTRR